MPWCCPKCKKVYRKRGRWLLRHLIEVCHVKILNPIELVPKQKVDLTTIMNRINHLEFIIKNAKFTHSKEDSIERIKAEETKKVTDPLLKQYRNAFKECISELKEVLKLRKEHLKELDVSQLQLVRE